MAVGDDDDADNEEEVLGVGDIVFPILKEVGDAVDEPDPFDDELLGVGDILFPVPKGVGGADDIPGPFGEELLVPAKKGVGRLDDASPPTSTVGDGLSPSITLVELAGIVGE